MCGIVGLVTLKKIDQCIARRNWFEKALFVDTLRGKDSTGVALIPHNLDHDIVTHKKAMPAPDYLELKVTDALFKDIDEYSCVIGHNRWATMGGVSAHTAHPFTHGDITMVHNGTMDYWGGLDKKKFDVDSEAICYELSVRNTKSVLEDLDGAYALVWYDASDNTMHFARNKERPFHFAFSKDKQTMLYASEAWMIDKLVPASLDMEGTFSLNVGKHITINLSEQTELDKYSCEDFKPVPPALSYYDTWGYDKGKKNQTMGAPPKPSNSTTIGKELLGRMGYTLGMTVNFYASAFEAYTKGNLGTLRGQTSWSSKGGIKSVTDRIISYGVNKCYNNNNYLLEGEVIGARYIKNMFTLILRDVDYAYGEVENAPKKEQHKIVNHKGETITQKKFDKLSKEGCALCGADVKSEDSDFIEWTDMGKPLCLDCTQAGEIGQQQEK